MPSQPKLVAPRFGEWLAKERGDRTYEQIAGRIRKLVTAYGLKVGRSAIVRYEQGRIPPWPILSAFADVYATTPDAVVLRLLRAIQIENGSDLIRPSKDQQSNLLTQGGSPDVPASASARILELETELAAHKARWVEATDVARHLLTIAITGAKGRAASGRKTRRSRSDRKAS